MNRHSKPASLPRILNELGPVFAQKAPELDEYDRFARDNVEDLRRHRVLSAMVPTEFGGSGHSFSEVAAFLRGLAGFCPSTALVLSMHQHVLASAIVNHRLGRPGRKLLETVGRNEALVVTTVANDWLASNGSARMVPGGFEVSAEKHFVSGAPEGDILMTSAILNDSSDTPSVLHFAIPMKSDGITREGGWRAHGMRATGSERVRLDSVFVPEEAVTLKRTGTELHPVFHVILCVAPTLIMACYAGIADRARALALEFTRKSGEDPVTLAMLSDLEIIHRTAQITHNDMVALVDDLQFTPSAEIIHEILIRKAIIAEQAISACEMAIEIAGGAGFQRANELERLLRDARAAKFHPLSAKQQPALLGRLARDAHSIPAAGIVSQHTNRSRPTNA